MSIGRKNQRVTFQTRTETQDASGQKVASYTTTFVDWAEVIPMAGKEKYQSSQLVEVADVKLNMRFRTNINMKMRFIVGSEFYNIHSIQEVAQQKATIVLGTLIAVT